MRVAILPTGRMEWAGVPVALNRLFPEHKFYSIPTEAEVASKELVDFPASSFTSCDVTRLVGKENNADKLVQRALREALGDRARTGADLVVILDDLELCNRNQPREVTARVREAAGRQLARLAVEHGNTVRFEEALRERVSFHLAKPMIESWLFPDRAALTVAGVQEGTPVLNQQSVDPEAFEAVDPDYAADDGTSCACWNALPDKSKAQRERKRKSRPQWLRADPNRRWHPKAYLAWLCRDPGTPTCTSYNETTGGASAIKMFNWSLLLGPPNQALFARSLIADLANKFGEQPPFGGALAPETDFTRRPRGHLLRNL